MSGPPVALGTLSISQGVRLGGVTKRFGDAAALDGLDLEIPNRSFTVLVGPSGCGKTTCLRLIAGLEQVDAGQVRIGDRDVTGVPARERRIAMVFQDFALYPHMTVAGNVGFGLRLEAKHDRRHGPSRQEIATRVGAVLELVGLGSLGERRPSQLSGGQRQRVALARAIVRQPAVFLMDEPLSNLDAQLRAQTRAELIRLHRRLDTTVIYVTHDQVEAMTMATRLAVMDRGAIVQVGPPEEVYRAPATTFVARFLGSPPMNLCRADTRPHGAATKLLGADLGGILSRTGLSGPVEVGWRPGQGELAGYGDDSGWRRAGLRLAGSVVVEELLGDDMLITVEGRWGQAAVLQPTDAPRPAIDAQVAIVVPARHLHLFDPTSGARLDLPQVPGGSEGRAGLSLDQPSPTKPRPGGFGESMGGGGLSSKIRVRRPR